MLLDHGADFNIEGIYGTALQAAAGQGHEEIVELLLDRGADNKIKGHYVTARQAARGRGANDKIRYYGTLRHGTASSYRPRQQGDRRTVVE